MKRDPDYAELAARFLARRIPAARLERPERDHGIGSVAQAMAERQRRRARTRLVLGGGVLVAVCALAVTANVRGQRDHGSGAGEVASARSTAVDLVGHAGPHEPGSRIVAVGGPRTVELDGSTRLSLEDRTEMLYEVLGTTRRFRLLRGAVRLRVGKLSANDRFIVETPDAEVEVRGTEFEVRLAPEPSRCTSPTSVSVFEGTVELRMAGETRRLSAGERFAACREEEASARAPAPSRSGAPPVLPRGNGALSEARAGSAAGEGRASRAVTPPAEISSSLSVQNALYARAVAAKRAGSPDEALRAYEELVTRFPGGPLEESAMAERMRLLAKLDPARAHSEARRYLRRFPSGFAREEAQEILGQQ